MQRIVFVEQFYYPDGWGGTELPRDLTTHLANRRYHVTVICGSDPYAPVVGDPGQSPVMHGVKIVRVPRMLGGNIHSFKLLRQLWFCVALIPLLLVHGRSALFVSQTNPPLAVPLVALAAWFWRRPYLLIAMDVYPEVLEAHGTIRPRGVVARFVGMIFDRAYRSAKRVVSLGSVMSERLRAKGVTESRIVEICNWSTGTAGVVRGEANTLRSEYKLQDKFVLVYSGNLGLGHEFETLVHGFGKALSQVPRVRLVVIGRGSRLAEVKDLVQTLGLAEYVQFSDFVPQSQLPESMGMADLAVVTLRPGFEGLIVPSKLLGYMSRGVPILYVGPVSDIDHYVTGYGCGISLRNGDVDGVCDVIVNASRSPEMLVRMGRAGLVGYNADLSRDVALRHYESVIADCIA